METVAQHSLDAHELAWAAGFFDGEGCTTTTRRKNGAMRPPRTTISQVDRRNLDRFRRAVRGIGRVSGPHKPKRQNASEDYDYATSSFADTQAVLALLWNWLGPSKRDQARRILREYRDQWQQRFEKRRICRNGHPKHPGQRCKRCHIGQHLRWRAKNPERWRAYMHEYWMNVVKPRRKSAPREAQVI